ncbi:MAG: flippase-like domain-containing protein [bacterium]|nr:flippase-like domain-containing protein [bacterium]
MKYLKLLVIAVIIVVLLLFFFKNVDFKEVMAIISSVDLIYPIVFLVGVYLQLFIRGYRWGLLLKPHKEKIPLMTLYNYTAIGFLLNMIPGKVGEPARGILLAGELKISRSYGLASVVLERLLDMFMVLVLFMISLFFLPESQAQHLSSLKHVALFLFPVVLLFFFLFYLLNTERMFSYVERLIRFFSKLAPAKIRERLVNFALRFVKGLRLNLSFPDYMKLMFLSMVLWLFLIPFYWFLMQGFDFGQGIGIFETVPYFCVIVASASIPTPGMAGSFDAASKLGLEKLYGVESNPAAAYTLLCHFLILIIMVVPGLIAFWAKGIHLQTIKEIKEIKNETGSQENEDEKEDEKSKEKETDAKISE